MSIRRGQETQTSRFFLDARIYYSPLSAFIRDALTRSLFFSRETVPWVAADVAEPIDVILVSAASAVVVIVVVAKAEAGSAIVFFFTRIRIGFTVSNTLVPAGGITAVKKARVLATVIVMSSFASSLASCARVVSGVVIVVALVAQEASVSRDVPLECELDVDWGCGKKSCLVVLLLASDSGPGAGAEAEEAGAGAGAGAGDGVVGAWGEVREVELSSLSSSASGLLCSIDSSWNV